MVYGFFYLRAGSQTDMYTKFRLVAVCLAVAIGAGIIGQLRKLSPYWKDEAPVEETFDPAYA